MVSFLTDNLEEEEEEDKLELKSIIKGKQGMMEGMYFISNLIFL
jgi:hypothetical protein